ncbi:DUF4412 domain-containing protein [Lacinutrix chionoecetis]
MAFSLIITAQEKLKEGVLLSKMTIASDDAKLNQQLAMGDVETTTYFKDHNSRIESKNPMTGNVVVITDNDDKMMLILMDNPVAGKVFKKQNIEQPKEDDENIIITRGESTKTILGYECNQYFVTTNIEGQQVEIEILATNAIDVYSQEANQFGKKIDGYPLYMKTKMSQMGADMSITNMTIVQEVTIINKEEIPDDKFDMAIPEGYTEMKQ